MIQPNALHAMLSSPPVKRAARLVAGLTNPKVNLTSRFQTRVWKRAGGGKLRFAAWPKATEVGESLRYQTDFGNER